AGQGVEVALAVDVPVVDAVGAGHDERLLRPLRHLVAHEDVAEELLIGGLGVGDQVREGRGGGHGLFPKKWKGLFWAILHSWWHHLLTVPPPPTEGLLSPHKGDLRSRAVARSGDRATT